MIDSLKTHNNPLDCAQVDIRDITKKHLNQQVFKTNGKLNE